MNTYFLLLLFVIIGVAALKMAKRRQMKLTMDSETAVAEGETTEDVAAPETATATDGSLGSTLKKLFRG